jgi:hypothetical protein
MKGNFHAIEAIAYGLGYGVKGLPTFFRLGWLPLLILAGVAFFLSEQGVDFNLGGAESGATVRVDESGDAKQFGFSTNRAFEIDPEEWTPAIAAAAGAAMFAFLLLIPAFVGMIRESAGTEVRSGFLPAFGKPEIAYLAAFILSFLIFVLAILFAVIAIALPLGLTGALMEGQLGEDAIGPVAVILLLVFILFMIWFGVRFSLFTTHAAATGEIAPIRAFALTGGRFWKLLGSYLLMGIIISLIGAAIELVGFAFGSLEMILIPLALMGASQIYQWVAQTGFAGRIVHDLLLTKETGETVVA